MRAKIPATVTGLLLAALLPAIAKQPASKTPPKTSAATETASKPGSKAAEKAKYDPDASVDVIARPSASRLAAMGWRIIDDPATGVRLGLPGALLSKEMQARMGSRWTSGQGQIDIETFRLHEAALAALFDDEKKDRHRVVGHAALKPDSFVISGMQGMKRFVERVEASGSELRGFTVMFDQATEGMMAPVAAAMTDAFQGFPDPNADPPAGLRRSVEYGTAIVVSDRGYLLTTASVVDQCQSIAIAGFGYAERLAVDKDDGLALLRLYGAANLSPVGFAADPGDGDAVTLVGIADPATRPGDLAVAHIQSRRTTLGFDPVPRAGFSGAAAVDAQGKLVGMVDLKWPQMASSEAAVGLQTSFISVEAIRSFLTGQNLASPAGRDPVDRSALRVICVRK